MTPQDITVLTWVPLLSIAPHHWPDVAEIAWRAVDGSLARSPRPWVGDRTLPRRNAIMFRTYTTLRRECIKAGFPMPKAA